MVNDKFGEVMVDKAFSKSSLRDQPDVDYINELAFSLRDALYQ